MGRFKYILKRILLSISLLGLILFGWFGGYRLIFSNSSLALSDSFYLRQHKNDLVKWRVWSDETIELAKKENKLLFISIDSFSNIWSLALQESSFENPITSKIINRYFIPVLVDKHQSRFVDKLYTDLMTYQLNRSGWPMIIITTPDGIPLYFTNFLNNTDLIGVLKILSDDWRNNAIVTQSAAEDWAKLYSETKQYSKYQQVTSIDDYFLAFFLNNSDNRLGGLKELNKFTYMRQYSILFDYGGIPLSHVENTISNIITSPSFDFVDGGIFRYSLGKNWFYPYFEKLFIDQVFFVKLLTQLYVKTGKDIYKTLAEYNLDFILRSFFDKKEGGFYTSLSAITLKKSNYYLFTDDLLDSLSPISFSRQQYSEGFNTISLVNGVDLIALDKAPLIANRKNSPFKLYKDKYLSIPDQVEFLHMLDLYDRTFNTQFLSIFSPNIMNHLERQLSRPQNLNNLLYLFDAFSFIGDDPILERLRPLITSNFNPVFPYDINRFSVNEYLKTPDFMDQYSYNQSVYFLLKYFNELELPIKKPVMCREVAKNIILPWFQLSYVDSLRHFCL